MTKYIIKRLLLAIPVLLILSIVVFLMSKSVPGDQVYSLLNVNADTESLSDPVISKKAYAQKFKSLGYDKPIFYFSILPKNYPDTLYRIYPKEKKERLKAWYALSKNWEGVQSLALRLDEFELKAFQFKDSLQKRDAIDLRHEFLALSQSKTFDAFQVPLNRLDQIIKPYGHLASLKSSYSALVNATETLKNENYKASVFPSFRWHGSQNQYHQWISKFIKADFGNSLIDQQPASKKIIEALKWTLVLNGLAILLVYFISIPLGWNFALKAHTAFDKLGSLILYMFYAIPVFWLATLLLIFFTTEEYGTWTDLFPSLGLGRHFGKEFSFEGMLDIAWHLVLPVLSLTLVSLAFISRQMRASTLNEMKSDYFRTGLAKGLSEKAVLKKHALRNALFPIITLIANVLPALFGGSLIIEVIFSIPGMGRLAFNAILSNDWPVLFAILLLVAFLTMIGFLIADILYAYLDPRVRFQRSSKHA